MGWPIRGKNEIHLWQLGVHKLFFGSNRLARNEKKSFSTKVCGDEGLSQGTQNQIWSGFTAFQSSNLAEF
jgi:hypothetical protein